MDLLVNQCLFLAHTFKFMIHKHGIIRCSTVYKVERTSSDNNCSWNFPVGGGLLFVWCNDNAKWSVCCGQNLFVSLRLPHPVRYKHADCVELHLLSLVLTEGTNGNKWLSRAHKVVTLPNRQDIYAQDFKSSALVIAAVVVNCVYLCSPCSWITVWCFWCFVVLSANEIWHRNNWASIICQTWVYCCYWYIRVGLKYSQFLLLFVVIK
jgi:hypothetical protein